MISHYYSRYHSRDSNNIFQCIIGRSILYWPCFLDGKRFQSIRWRGIKWHGYYYYKNCLELNFHFMTGNEKRGRWPQTLGDFVHHVCDKVYKASQTLRSANGYFYWHYGQSFWIDLGNIWEQLVLLVAAHQSIPDISSGLSENSPWKLSVLSRNTVITKVGKVSQIFRTLPQKKSWFWGENGLFDKNLLIRIYYK